MLAAKGASFRVTDDPSIDTTSRTGKLVIWILALIAEFENDIRRERQMDGIAKAKERGVTDASTNSPPSEYRRSRFFERPALSCQRSCGRQGLVRQVCTAFWPDA
jgi:DNA invertase Pin-like site-specific DNA recombinase